MRTQRENTGFSIFAILVAAYIVRLALVLAGSDEYLMNHTLEDDAYYYLEIGRNVWERGLFPSFDGLTKTNGFHMLYQLLLLPLVPLYTTSLRSTILVVCLANAALHLLGSTLLWRTLRLHVSPKLALALTAAVMLAAFPFKQAMNGMETALAFALSMTFVWLSCARRTSPWLRGSLLGLLILARIDIGAFYALVVGGYNLMKIASKKTGAAKDLAKIVTSSAAIVAPFVAFNLAVFGHIGTISAATKMYAARYDALNASGAWTVASAAGSLWHAATLHAKNLVSRTIGDFFALPHALSSGDLLRASDSARMFEALIERPWIPITIWGAIIALAALAARQLVPRDHKSQASIANPEATNNRPILVLLLLLTPVLHATVSTLMLGRHAQPWYWMWLWLAVGFGLVLLSERAKAPLFLSSFGLWALAIIGLLSTPLQMSAIGAYQKDYVENGPYTGGKALVDVINAELPPGTHVGSFNAGVIGYLSRPPVINLDGLANTFDYLEVRREKRVREYLRKMKIEYVADYRGWERYLEDLDISAEDVSVIKEVPQEGGFLIKIDP